VLAAYLVMYVPTYVDVVRTFSGTQYGNYSLIVVAVCAWLIWRERVFLVRPTYSCKGVGGLVLVALGLLMFVVGRSQTFYQLEVGSQLPLLAGISLLMYGLPGLRKFWFPIFLLLFAVPVPGSILDQVLLALKEWVSSAADSLLHWAGYPTARNGVMLSIGPYQLLMADACSGLNSIIALMGVCLGYVYLNWSRRSPLVAGLLLASILPIAFVSNVIRVILLMLATYYGGESTGQALHDSASYFEIALVFSGLFGFDWCLRKLLPGTLHPAHIRTELTA